MNKYSINHIQILISKYDMFRFSREKDVPPDHARLKSILAELDHKRVDVIKVRLILLHNKLLAFS